MEKNLICILITFLALSCGSFVDPLKMKGIWNLKGVTFYTYDQVTDSYKKYTGIDDLTPDDTNPIFGDFFGMRVKDVKLQLFESNTFELNAITEILSFTQQFDNTSDLTIDIATREEKDVTIVNTVHGEWNADSFENSLTFTISKNYSEPTSDSYWQNRDFTIKNYWPLSTSSDTNTTLQSYTDTIQLYIRATDVEMDYFPCDLSGDKSINVYAMEGLFVKE